MSDWNDERRPYGGEESSWPRQQPAAGGPPPAYPPPSGPPVAPPDYGSPPGAGYGPSSYGPSGPYGYGQQYSGWQPKTDGMATTSLVLGILGLLVCGIVFGIGAIVTGSQARNRIAASDGRLKGAGMALAGIILGAIDIVTAVVVLLYVFSSNA